MNADVEQYVFRLRKRRMLLNLVHHVKQWLCQCMYPLPEFLTHQRCLQCNHHYRPQAFQPGDKVMGHAGKLYCIVQVYDRFHFGYAYHAYPVQQSGSKRMPTVFANPDGQCALRFVSRSSPRKGLSKTENG